MLRWTRLSLLRVAAGVVQLAQVYIQQRFRAITALGISSLQVLSGCITLSHTIRVWLSNHTKMPLLCWISKVIRQASVKKKLNLSTSPEWLLICIRPCF